MKKSRLAVRRAYLVAAQILAAATPIVAHDLSKQVALTGVASLGGQCQRLSSGDPDEDLCRSALAFQPALSFHPSERHELFFKLGFAAGNGLNDITRFSIHPWAADLEDSVNNINGQKRDHLLTAWYRHSADLGGGDSLRITAGIIDSTKYVDTNIYSNDEYTQFMNSALVNGPNVFAPSYAPGLAGQWHAERLSLTGVYMHVSRSDADSYDFYGAEIDYHLDTRLGRGNYRLLLDTTSRDFAAPNATSRERLTALLLSCDQQFGDSLGAFLRFSWQNDDAAIDYRALYSAGLDIGGRAWGRPRDNIGVGYAHLTGGNLEIERSRVAEVYYRFVVITALAITGDIQYMGDDLRGAPGPAGFVFGLRVTAQY
jgi:porin